MEESTAPFETLKQILRHARNPDALNEHTWTHSLFVEQALTANPQLRQVRPGQQLIGALAGLFPELQPATPPRSGKRLDPRWGEFGLLAALYFTPFNNGTSYPTSLVDAWGRIDHAILTCVYGKSAEELAEEQVKPYQLVGADLEFGSPSTLSDWHRKGLQRFSEIILNRERCLSRTSAQPSVILSPGEAATRGLPKPKKSSRSYVQKRSLRLVIALLLLGLLGLGMFKAWGIYQSGMLVYQDVISLQNLLNAPVEIGTVEAAVPRLQALKGHLTSFKKEARPALWLSPRLGWVPVYGNDLVSAMPLIETAEHMLRGSLISIEAALPLLDEFDSRGSTLDPTSLTALLLDAEPGLGDARQELDAALAARGRIDAERLSPRLRTLMEEEVDPLLKLADEGLSLAAALPRVLGAGSDGPKTYMLLIQNEDELRPTGGFITSVGSLVLHRGEIIRLAFESVDNDVQEDWSQPYPAAPWQLQEYMDSPVLILRDANWFSDFPTTALWAEYLYAYTHSHSVDGVIAIDQQFLVMLLGAIGPLEVDGAPYAITENNVIEYMRQAKIPPVGEEIQAGWDRKEFISQIADSILMDLNSGNEHDWRRIANALTRALAQRHLLLQFDEPIVAALVTERGWDYAIHPEAGDFLMVTDTNIGGNKTNAAVDIRLDYEVDLSDLASPVGTLTVRHKNNSPKVSCSRWEPGQMMGDEWYPIHRCYWTYTRVYKQAGVELTDATPHSIPADWTLLYEPVPARVDALTEELAGAQGFGTFLVVPGGKELDTSFRFALPDGVLLSQDGSGAYLYRLKVQKQPGTLAIPLSIRIRLPSYAGLRSISLAATVQGQHVIVEADLRTDVEVDVVFTVP